MIPKLPRSTRFVLTLLVPVWAGAYIEHHMPERWRESILWPAPTTWWAIPYFVTQCVGAGATISKLIDISGEKDRHE